MPAPLWDQPVHKAALSGDIEQVKWLVRLGRSLLESPGFNGILPLLCAARRGALPVIRFLLAAGADAAGRDHGQWTALHHAAAGGHDAVLEALLLGDGGGKLAPLDGLLDVDARAGDGSTALLVAVTEGHLDAVRFLLLAGADPAAANAKGESALAHVAKFQAAMVRKAALYHPAGTLRKNQATRDRETIARLVHSPIYTLAVLRRLREGAWGQPPSSSPALLLAIGDASCMNVVAVAAAATATDDDDEERGESAMEVVECKEKGVLTALVRETNDDVFVEALRYLGHDEAEAEDGAMVAVVA